MQHADMVATIARGYHARGSLQPHIAYRLSLIELMLVKAERASPPRDLG